ncbi:MAG: CHAD domain-containing protein [Desulforhopalus sp.]|jgi:CHAD domain-containing protein
MDSLVYIGHSALKVKTLNKSLAAGTKGYKIRDKKGAKVEGVILDTFDNVLLGKEFILLGLEGGLVVVNLKDGGFIEQEFTGNWRFAADLPAGPITDLLSSLSELRAFLPVARIKIRQDKGALLDDEGKTRARYTNLLVERGDASISLGVVTSLRGYQNAYEDLVKILKDNGVEALDKAAGIYRLLGVKRDNYVSKPILSLDAGAAASETAATIIREFIKTARVNEPGIIADYDTEFLHDYRVSFRKVRSVLSLFKGVYGAEKTAELKNEFSAIMQGTNRLRDLDVYLMEKEHYFSLVPKPSLVGLTLLFDFFAKERSGELKAVRQNLGSAQYKSQVEGLRKLFKDSKSLPLGPKGKLPSKVLASKLVLKRYSQVCRIAVSIEKSTKDEVVHELRISCKKLRYLMEFFTPLFPREEIKQLIKTLKILQDNLGKFNDYSVQQEFLRRVLEDDLKKFKGDEMLVTEAIGALTAMLYSLQKEERSKVMKNFTRFNSEETRVLFKQLFQQKGDA